MKPLLQSRAAPALGMLLLALLVTVTAVEGAFTIDESHYLASLIGLRHGRLSLPDTDGLPPSIELYAFDPLPDSRAPFPTPAAPTVPPLWAVMALPFSFAGWQGLVFLNALAYALCGLLLFRHGAALSTVRTGALAAVALLFGSYCLEYAQGVWPHMLAMALTLGCFLIASHVREGAAVGWAALAGALGSLAAGVRYQNVVFTAAVGLGLLIWCKRRLLASALFALGAAVPLAASALMNRARLGHGNPVSKGAGYVAITDGPSFGDRFVEALSSLWVKVVDFRGHPTMGGGGWEWAKDVELGAFLRFGASKKAWLQSSPWILIALVVLALAWRAGAGDSRTRRELRAASLVVAAVVGMFIAFGFRRTDAECFNQRYFIELLPLVALALGLGADELLSVAKRRDWIDGALLGVAFALPAVVTAPYSPLRVSWQMNVPLLLAPLALLLFWLSRVKRLRPSIGAAAIAAAIAYAGTVHVGDDVRASRFLRTLNGDLMAAFDAGTPPRSALFAFSRSRDAAGPIRLWKDVVVLDTSGDAGRDAPMLIQALTAAGRRVFIDSANTPKPILDRLGTFSDLLPVEGLPLLEVRPR